MDLRRHWTGAEFNIFGDCCDSRADSTPGRSPSAWKPMTGLSGALLFNDKGTTGESNSLSFIAAPSRPPHQQYPSILFTEGSTSGSAAPSCDIVAGL